MATSDLQELDAPIFTLIKSALEKEMTTEEDIETFFVQLINPDNEDKSLEYLTKIGYPEAEGQTYAQIVYEQTIAWCAYA